MQFDALEFGNLEKTRFGSLECGSEAASTAGLMTQLALHGKGPEYKARSPEHTVLYKAVANHVESFFALAESGGRNLPKHVKKEFEEFLRCGILAYGFLRLKCGECKSEKLVAFSCKKRGFCSSCGGRRMNESAVHLVAKYFPRALACASGW